MAVEVEAHKYLFAKLDKDKYEYEDDTSEDDSSSGSSDSESLQDGRSSTLRQDTNVIPPPPYSIGAVNGVPFLYNPLHDMESLWWLALFLVLAALPAALKITTAQKDAQNQLVADLFCNPKLRLQTFAMSPGLGPHLVSLHPRVANIVWVLETMRLYLTSAFTELERGLKKPVPFSAAPKLYPMFKSEFHTITSTLRKGNVHVAVNASALREQLKDAPQKKDEETQSANVETTPIVEEIAPIVDETAPIVDETAPIVNETTPVVEDSRDARPTKRMKTGNKTQSSTRQQHAGPTRRSQRLRVRKTMLPPRTQ